MLTLVRCWAGWIVSGVLASSADAAPMAPASGAAIGETPVLVIEAHNNPCLQALPLDREIQRIRTTIHQPRLQIFVEEKRQSATLSITWEGDTRVHRRFNTLPRKCDDRLALVAVAIAVALDDRFPEVPAVPVAATEPNPAPETTPVLPTTADTAASASQPKSATSAAPASDPLYSDPERSALPTDVDFEPVAKRRTRPPRRTRRIVPAKAWTLALGAGLQGSAAPSLGLRSDLAVRRYGRFLAWTVALGTDLDAPITFAGGTIRIRHFYARLSPCLALPREDASKWRWIPCVDFQSELLHTQGRGFDRNKQMWLEAPAFRIGASLGVLRQMHRRFAIEVRGNVALELTTTRLIVLVENDDPSSSTLQRQWIAPRLRFGVMLLPTYRF